ncbi:MAG: plasmid stabilization protein [Roseiarcus sp.]
MLSDIIAHENGRSHPQSAKELDALPADARHAVTEALSAYAIDGRGDVKALAGCEVRRLRVGDCRVIFDDDGATILTIDIGRRRTTTYARN